MDEHQDLDNYQHIRNLINNNNTKEADEILAPLKAGNDPWVWCYSGISQFMQGNLGSAASDFERCIELDAANDVAHYNYGTIAVRRGNTQLARKHFDKVRELVPDAVLPRLDKAVVFIGLPHYGRIPMEFMLSYCDMITRVKPSDNIELLMANCCGSRITSNRNQLVKMAQRKGATHILFIDTDMIWPNDALQRLLTHGRDIVCATTCKRGDEEGIPIGCAIAQEGGKPGVVEVRGGLVEMRLVGSCFMLIRMEVFDKIGLPAYYEPPDAENGDAFGEDITFCKLATAAGYRIWLDYNLSAELGHLGDKVYQIKPKVTPLEEKDNGQKAV